MRKSAVLARWAVVAGLIASVVLILNPTSSVRAEDDHGDYRSQSTAIKIDGRQIAGQIDPTDVLFDVDYFSFEAVRGVAYTFALNFVTVEDANIQVLNSQERGARRSSGQILSNGNGRKTVDWIARTSDVYFVEISGTIRFDGTPLYGSYLLSSTADMSLEDRHTGSQNGASPIELDNVYQGAISPWTNQPGLMGTSHGGDDLDFFLFQANRGVKYSVDVELGTAEGVAISIVGPAEGTEITNSGLNTSLEWISPKTTDYFIVVSGSSRFQNSIGTYSLTLRADSSYEDRHSENSVGASPLSFNTAHQGAVSPGDDHDVFVFQAERGVRYDLESNLGTVQGVNLSVEDANGGVVITNNSVGAGLEWTSPADSTYYIVVSGSSLIKDNVGTYTLLVDADTTLRDRHGESAEQATPVSFGNEHRSAISPSNDRDYFSFSARRGVRYSVNATPDESRGLEIKIVAPDGAIEVSNGGLDSAVNWTSETNDTYFVVVTSPPHVSDQIGTYGLKVEANELLQDRHGDHQGAATVSAVGSTYEASISPEGDGDYYSFEANRGMEYSFELTYGTAGPLSLTVSKFDGNPAAARNFGDGTDVVWIAPESDEYFVAVTGSPRAQDSTGTYSLRIGADTALEDRHSGVAIQGTTLVLGNAVAGAISPSDDADYFYFDAEQGQTYVALVNLGSVEAVRLSVTHFLAGFTTSNYSGGARLEWQAPITGRYNVLVTGWEQAANPVGTYQINITTPEAEAAAAVQHVPPPASPTPSPTPIPPPVGPALIVDSRTAPPGGIVRVPVLLQAAAGLTSLAFTINYNPALAEVMSVARGSRMSAATFSFDANAPGVVRVGFAAANGFSGGGSAAVVELRIIGEQDSASLIGLSDVLASDSAGERFSLQLADGILTVGNPRPGDGDGDGQVTALDALIALKASLGLFPKSSAMDINGDGAVTLEDVRLILTIARPE